MSSVLKVDKLRKEFGGLVAVRDVSFEVNEGEFIGLIGPNGCGKSTTFNCISGSLEQTSGNVEFFGKDISHLRPDEIQKIGMTRTFQHTRLWREMTVIENLLVPPRDQFKPNIWQSIWQGRNKPVEVDRLAKAYSTLDQLEVPHMAHNLASELSGGQSKLVDIGRSMMGDPKLLLLDGSISPELSVFELDPPKYDVEYNEGSLSEPRFSNWSKTPPIRTRDNFPPISEIK